MHRLFPSPTRQLPVLILLLLFLFALRAHHPLVQEPYLDEAFHIKRASLVWSFDQHPGRFAHGKLLEYFWLGLFQPEAPSGLAAARLATVLFALITGSSVYAIGRRLGGSLCGLLALGLYTCLPLAFYYERLAMADPLAAGLAALVAWRGLALARRPSLAGGAFVGLLLALATLAKLTMGLLPALPVAATLIYTPWSRSQSLMRQTRQWLWRYAPPLMTAALVMTLVWLPVLIPAEIARRDGNPFTLVNDYNLRANDTEPVPSNDYLTGLVRLAADLTSWGLLVALTAAALLVLFQPPPIRREGLFLVTWIGVLLAPAVLVARLLTLRYAMPVAVPLVLILARAASALWETRRARLALRASLLAAGAVWVIGFALPFAATDLRDPEDLKVSGANRYEIKSGALTADDGIRLAAAWLDAAEPPDVQLFGNWSHCHLMLLYTQRDITCLPLSRPAAQLAEAIQPTLTDIGDAAYVALLHDYQTQSFQSIPGFCWEEVIRFQREKNLRAMVIWRVERCQASE